MEKLKIEYIPLDSIKPYKRNAKLHPQEQIEQIKASMREFGNIDPIGIWHNEIVEGHGRYIAARELGYSAIPVIRLDQLTDEQRKAYALVHNKLTMNSGFDLELLNAELGDLDIDLGEYGLSSIDDYNLDVNDDDFITGTEITKSKTKTVTCPHCGEQFEV